MGGWTVRQAAKLMIEKAYSQLPVRDGDRNIGRITELMICRELQKSAPNALAEVVLRELALGRPFEVVPPGMGDKDVLEKLKTEEALLVAPEQDRRIGSLKIITRADFIERVLR